MLSIVKSMSLIGLDGYLVSVEVDVAPGIPSFDIVGLPDASIRESRERVQTAIKNSGIHVTGKKIIVNLAPANTKKEGSMFDLPMAIGILIATDHIRNKNIFNLIEDTIFIGELSLDGNINRISGILPICIEAKKIGIKQIILPEENAEEASIIEGIDILPVSHLTEIISYLNGNMQIKPRKCNNEKIKNEIKYDIDFAEVRGQENVKRALQIAAAGNHNCLLIRRTRLRKNNDSKAITNNTTRHDI